MELLVLALVLTAATVLAFSQKPRTFKRVPRVAPPSPPPTWVVEVSRGATMEREVELVPPVVKIGRDERSHLRLEADGVQRFHSVLELDGAELTLVDLGTLEGTALNGHKVHRAVVKAGDHITIGGFTLAVRTRS